MEYCHFLRATWLAAGLYAYLAFPGMVQRQSDFWNKVFDYQPPTKAVLVSPLIVPLDPVGGEVAPEDRGSVARLSQEPKAVSPPIEYYPLTVSLVMNQGQ